MRPQTGPTITVWIRTGRRKNGQLWPNIFQTKRCHGRLFNEMAGASGGAEGALLMCFRVYGG
jgi:hypothetical protein